MMSDADTKILESAFSSAHTAMDHERQGAASPPAVFLTTQSVLSTSRSLNENTDTENWEN
jgi:hypothetical protein